MSIKEKILIIASVGFIGLLLLFGSSIAVSANTEAEELAPVDEAGESALANVAAVSDDTASASAESDKSDPRELVVNSAPDWRTGTEADLFLEQIPEAMRNEILNRMETQDPLSALESAIKRFSREPVIDSLR